MQYTLIKTVDNILLIELTKVEIGTLETPIASVNPMTGLPKLILSDEVASIIGYVDVENGYYKKHTIGFDEEMIERYGFEAKQDAKIYSEGYTQCLNDNKDKLYTEADIENAFTLGALKMSMADDDTTSNELWKVNKNELIHSLSKKEWEVEVEMKHFDDLDMITHVTMSSPKITNNTITVIKIIE